MEIPESLSKKIELFKALYLLCDQQELTREENEVFSILYNDNEVQKALGIVQERAAAV